MKSTLLVTLAISACIGNQVLWASATRKIGTLSFALTDTYQYRVYQNGVQTETTVDDLVACLGNVKYETKSEKIDNKRILGAITKALGCTFTTKDQLVVVNYDNYIPAPPYPPYLVDPASETFNGPRDTAGYLIAAMETWPNERQIDWVEYDLDNAPGDVGSNRWPKAMVFVSDPSNATAACMCKDVSPFFSFEEAYCYFCYDTVDRVTAGNLTTGSSTTGDICIGTETSCGTKGSGTTKWYMTIKFNNTAKNIWFDQFYGFESPVSGVAGDDNVSAALWFTVGGVVNYPWKYTTKDNVYTVFGTMTMSQATGYGQNPYCGVLNGSVKITETTNAKTPICLESGD
jgi:hypothetical protein